MIISYLQVFYLRSVNRKNISCRTEKNLFSWQLYCGKIHGPFDNVCRNVARKIQKIEWQVLLKKLGEVKHYQMTSCSKDNRGRMRCNWYVERA